VSNGDSVVVVAPMDPNSGADYRLFYGAPGAMAEHTLQQVAADCCGTYFEFSVNGTSYWARFELVNDGDGGVGTSVPGPGTLDTGAGMLPMTQRTPTPQTLTGFAFTCLGS
jgi:hypothetical protein